ncbi:MAG: cytochrome C [Caldilineaceae bacterium]
MATATQTNNKDMETGSTKELSTIAKVSRQSSFRLSTALLITAAAILAISTFLPYWRIRLNAPQYPTGLFVIVYVNHMEGDVREVDGLNHYIGMAPLEEAANIERSLAPIAMVVIALMIISVAFIHSKWFAILAIPAMFFPFVFLADMWVWLWYYGNHLDPTAALSSSIKPFTPAILGTGVVGQFSTTAVLQIGWYLALLAAILTGVGLHYRRQARLAVERLEIQ